MLWYCYQTSLPWHWVTWPFYSRGITRQYWTALTFVASESLMNNRYQIWTTIWFHGMRLSLTEHTLRNDRNAVMFTLMRNTNSLRFHFYRRLTHCTANFVTITKVNRRYHWNQTHSTVESDGVKAEVVDTTLSFHAAFTHVALSKIKRVWITNHTSRAFDFIP